MIIELLKKINFSILIDDSELSFNWEELQYGKIYPILFLNNNLYITKESKIRYYQINQSEPIYLSIENNLDKEESLFHILLISELSNYNDLNKEKMNGIYSQLQENIEKYKKEVFQKFLSTKFFIDKSGILSRIWSFLYSLNINSEILNYLTNNFLLPEKTFYDIILNDFYLKINNIEDINKYVNFSKQMNFFYEENGFLWMDLIEQKIPSDKDQDFYNNLLIEINKEISSLSILKNYESLKNEYNNCYQILDKKKDEIKEKIKYNENDRQKKEFEKQISELKNRIRELNLRKEIQKWKIII